MSVSVQSNEGPTCPFCDHVHDEAENWDDVVTYWGEQTVEYACAECGEKFLVEETVERTWISTLISKSEKIDE